MYSWTYHCFMSFIFNLLLHLLSVCKCISLNLNDVVSLLHSVIYVVVPMFWRFKNFKPVQFFKPVHIFQISQKVQILNCLSFHMVTHLLYDWEYYDRIHATVIFALQWQLKIKDKLARSQSITIMNKVQCSLLSQTVK